jgi:hypothetical protein
MQWDVGLERETITGELGSLIVQADSEEGAVAAAREMVRQGQSGDVHWELEDVTEGQIVVNGAVLLDGLSVEQEALLEEFIADGIVWNPATLYATADFMLKREDEHGEWRLYKKEDGRWTAILLVAGGPPLGAESLEAAMTLAATVVGGVRRRKRTEAEVEGDRFLAELKAATDALAEE